MPRVVWPLLAGRPVIQGILTSTATGLPVLRDLLADTGAGRVQGGFELILAENDCLGCGGLPAQPVVLGGAYAGSFPVCVLRMQIPALGFDQYLRAVGVGNVPAGLGGIASFRFLNQFTYGNFGSPSQFGLEG
jgi:hypothetical protein